MRKALTIVSLLAALSAASPAAADFASGVELLQRGEVDAAVKEFTRDGARGSVNSQLMLGHLYFEGKAVKQDYGTAASWYRLAAKKGNAVAADALGHMHLNGLGMKKKDVEGALEWYRKAAAQGFAPSQASLGFLYEKGLGVPQDFRQAAEWYLPAAKQGIAAAQHNLGALFALGKGVPQDFAEAAFWLRKAAAQGEAGAQAKLDILIAQGWVEP